MAYKYLLYLCRFLTVGMIFSVVSCLDTNDDNYNGNEGASKKEVFQALGINTVHVERVDAQGNELRDDFNPIGHEIAPLGSPLREIYLLGSQVNGQEKEQALFDNISFTGDQSVDPGTPLFQESFDTWSDDNPKKSIAADIDGDGLDEIVTAVFYRATNNSEALENKIALRVVDHEENIAKEVISFDSGLDLDGWLSGRAAGSGDVDEYDRCWPWADAYYSTDLASGDVDGDGLQEIILVIGVQIYVFDDYTTTFTQLGYKELSSQLDGVKDYIRVDTADFDQDGLDEIVIVHGEEAVNFIAKCTIFNDPQLQTTLVDQKSVEVGLQRVMVADVVTGDFDNDKLPEVAMVGRRNDGNPDRNYYVMVLNTEMDTSSRPVFSFFNTVGSIFHDDVNNDGKPRFVLQPIAAGNFDGEPGDEIVTFDDIFKLVNTGSNWELQRPFGSHKLRVPFDWAMSYDYPRGDAMAMGDINGDKKDDIVYIANDRNQLFIISHINQSTLQYNIIYLNNVDYYVSLALPNVDNDSLVVRYMGSSLTYSDPVVLAALASPPYWEGINEDGEGETVFGEINSSSGAFENSMGIHSSVTLGAEFGASFYNLVKLEGEVKTVVETSFTWGLALEYEYSETWGYVAGLGENRVIFTALPYDVYVYQVISSPDGGGIGEAITINVPRRPQRYSTTVAFYNTHNGDYEDIDELVLKHQLGQPFTYHTKAERDTIKEQVGERPLSGGYTAGSDEEKGIFPEIEHAVGEGTAGTTTIDVEKTGTVSQSFAWAESVSVELEVVIGWFIVGSSSGVHTEQSYTMSSTDGVYLGGSVPSIPSDYYDAEHRFNWGFMCYPHETSAGQHYTVITYYVD